MCEHQGFKTGRMFVNTYDHQCFCEAKPPKEVTLCGQEGEQCSCNGTVLFGKQYSGDGEKAATFEQMIADN